MKSDLDKLVRELKKVNSALEKDKKSLEKNNKDLANSLVKAQKKNKFNHSRAGKRQTVINESKHTN